MRRPHAISVTGVARTVKPTTQAIAWTAGFYEGEGSISFAKNTLRVEIAQNDNELLELLVLMFGGRINTRKPPRHFSTWYIHGIRAYGFILTIYKFLSTRRREQAKKALVNIRSYHNNFTRSEVIDV